MVSIATMRHHRETPAPEHPVAADEPTGRSRDRGERIQPRHREERAPSRSDGAGSAAGSASRTRAVDDLGPGDHLGILGPGGPADGDWFVPLVRNGLQARERVLVLSGSSPVERLRERLEQAGVAVDRSVNAGSLATVPAEDVFLRNGVFDEDRALAFVEAEIAVANAVGYGALRLVTDLGWALGRLEDWRPVFEYERRLGEILEGTPSLAVCHYDEHLVRARKLPGFLCCHPRWLGHLPDGRDAHGREEESTVHARRRAVAARAHGPGSLPSPFVEGGGRKRVPARASARSRGTGFPKR